MNTRFLTILISLAFLGLSVSVLAGKPDKCPTWPSCDTDPEPEPGPEYTAALTMGGFRFEAVNITLNNRDSGYNTSTSTLDMSRPCSNAAPVGQVWEDCGKAGSDEYAWDGVFLACNEVLGGVQIEGITVGTDWGITQGGKRKSDTAHNIRITFRTVVADGFPDVDIWISLHTWESYPRSMFLPEAGQTSVYELDTAKVYGDDVANHLSCNTGEFPLLKNARLEICHKTYIGPGIPSSDCVVPE
jgi:hypothetical protein